MIHFLAWYLTLIILGALTFPLVYRLFPKFADRGYSFTRAAGMLIWGYAFWMLTSLGIAQNNIGGLMLGLAVLIALSLWASQRGEGLRDPLAWLKDNLKLVFTVEILFLLSFALIALLRAANPEALGTEKPMELAFINAILRSPTFPPRDPWLSGYAISYYHFGFIMTAMLAKLTATAGSLAFNLMTALIFALSAIGAYGILYNLQSTDFRLQTLDSRHQTLDSRLQTLDFRHQTLDSRLQTLDFRHQTLDSRHQTLDDSPRHSRFNFHYSALLAPLFLLLISNFEGFLAIIHQYKFFWPSGSSKFNFWIWLDMKELSQDPATLTPIPERFWWWWRASRVIQDYDLLGNFRETIDEFPFFSFLLGDLHPHVLSMPFALLAIAVALNIFLGGWRGETKILTFRFHLKPLGLFSVALILGGLAFLNTWDILIAAALIASAYLFSRIHEDGWSWSRLEDFLYFGLLTGIAAILLYLPFYLGFASQAGGILPNLINPTRGAHLWVMFGTLLLPIFFWMIYLWRSEKTPVNWRSGFALALGLPLFLWLFSWLIAWGISRVNPGLAMPFLDSQNLSSLGELFSAATPRRLETIAGALTLLFVTGGSLSLLWNPHLSSSARGRGTDSPLVSRGELKRGGTSFTLLLILLGSLLVLAPEYFYLRDQFGTRMNTIFKFYYQAWLLWSLAAAYGAASLLQKLRGGWDRVHRTGLALLLIAGLIYPVFGVISKTDSFSSPADWTLDGAAHITRSNPDEAAAIVWLQSAPDGIVLEAVGGSYTGYARISTNSGLPTLLGWPGHEAQWRGGYAEMGSRQKDIEMIYTTSDWDTTKAFLDHYQVRYVVVGLLEKSTYHVDETKFQHFLEPVFSQGATTIYLVP